MCTIFPYLIKFLFYPSSGPICVCSCYDVISILREQDPPWSLLRKCSNDRLLRSVPIIPLCSSLDICEIDNVHDKMPVTNFVSGVGCT